ncbi:iron-sulfur cluster assembly scaffold protein [Treponema endosymbiont of Eucomonympha sp.]|uniref:iron-sulfur cluster assembly scaffold protein n=2 Tax=Treponema endosymbiont of Eucomonympha sp. TaxID=1580831 RepID=UPI000785C914|nr:iron-sulfur cluster assembly scaffold protein [Treponema endosymbiont of Eucomonympha sp.]
MNDWLYSDTVKEHFTNPRNVLYENESTWKHDGRGVIGNIKCGDQMLMLIRVKDDMIVDVRWKTYGCASAIASTSILSETIKGMLISEAYKLKPDDIVARLNGLPPNKIHCSVLGDKALRAAIDDYLAKAGRQSFRGQEHAEVICRCLNVTDRDLEEAYKKGDRTWENLQARTKLGTACGSCKEHAMEKMHEFEHLYE